MKLSSLLAIIALAAAPAFAHVEKGIYAGATPDGQPCQLNSLGTRFINDQPHPLNERVEVEVNGLSFTLQHPVVISVEDSVAAFNHDSFEGIMATPVGGTALVIAMDHSQGSEGPKSYTLITHAWKANERSKIECNGLKFSEVK